ncbi:hypothetical protein ACC723_37715, partial [Rhizobium ruizarguesonis]
YSSCHSLVPLEGETCTAVTLYSGQFFAQSEKSVVQVSPSNGPSEWQLEYEEQARQSRRIAGKIEAAE